MKTNNPDLRELKRIITIKSKYGTPALWVCGKLMWRRLTAVGSRKTIYFSMFGTRSIYDIPVRIGHPKVKDDEIILFIDKELKYL